MNFKATLQKINAVTVAAEVMRHLAQLLRGMPSYTGDLDARGHVAILELLALSGLLDPSHFLARVDAARTAMTMISARCACGEASTRAREDAARLELVRLYDLVDALQIEAARPAPENVAPAGRGPRTVEITVIPPRLSKSAGAVAAGGQ